MFLIKVLLFLGFAHPANAQQKVFSSKSFGFSHIQFQEDLKLQKNITRDTDLASYRGTILQYQKQSSVQKIGLSMGAIVGTGRAVAVGSGEKLTYSGGANWILLGLKPKAYYRWTRPISFGVQGLAFYKNTTWNDVDGVSAESKHNFNFALLGDISTQLTPQVEFVQSVGSINGDSTLWKIGVNYLF